MPVEQNPFDTEEKIEYRISHEDPYVQYYIVRKDIQMSTGKIAAQVAHGAQMFAFRYKKLEGYTYCGTTTDKLQNTEKWMNESFRKVVLGGKAKDFEKIKKELDVFVVTDAGLTEIDPGTETVLVTWPMLKSSQPKTLSKLQVLGNPRQEHQNVLELLVEAHDALMIETGTERSATGILIAEKIRRVLKKV